jgi:hypothetical protein
VNLSILWIGIIFTTALETGLFLILVRKIGTFPALLLRDRSLLWVIIEGLTLRVLLASLIVSEKERGMKEIILSAGCLLLGTPFGLIALYFKRKK